MSTSSASTGGLPLGFDVHAPGIGRGKTAGLMCSRNGFIEDTRQCADNVTMSQDGPTHPSLHLDRRAEDKVVHSARQEADYALKTELKEPSARWMTCCGWSAMAPTRICPWNASRPTKNWARAISSWPW